jgi:hypothetical protein
MTEFSPRQFTKSHRKGNFMVMARDTNQFAIAMLFGTLLLGIPVLCAGKTAKTCPDCGCIWLDASGKQSVTPVPILIRERSEQNNDFNYAYEAKSDPAAKKKCEGKTCNCRIIVRTMEVVKDEKHVSDLVRHAGKGDHSYRLGNFKKEDAEAKKKGGGVELIPACVLLGEDGEPEYGTPH